MRRALEIKDERGCYFEGEVTKQEEILLRVTDEDDRPAAAILSRAMALGLVRWLADQGISLAPEAALPKHRYAPEGACFTVESDQEVEIRGCCCGWPKTPCPRKQSHEPQRGSGGEK